MQARPSMFPPLEIFNMHSKFKKSSNILLWANKSRQKNSITIGLSIYDNLIAKGFSGKKVYFAERMKKSFYITRISLFNVPLAYLGFKTPPRGTKTLFPNPFSIDLGINYFPKKNHTSQKGNTKISLSTIRLFPT